MKSEMHLPVIVVALVSSALLQDMLPATSWMPVKLTLLSAAALYYMISRPLLPALTATLWAGLLTDALGGLPLLCTTGFLLFAYGVIHFLRGVIYGADVLTGTLLCAGFSPLQMIWTRIWTGAAGIVDIQHGFAVLGYSIIAGAIAGATGFSLCLLLDNFSGCMKPAKEKHGLSWTEAD